MALTLLVVLAVLVGAQTLQRPDSALRGVIRLRVRMKTGDAERGLQRKRFFLIKGSLVENRNLIQTIEQQSVVSRDCYYRGIGASEQLIRWLKENDCESVYCREVQENEIDSDHAVPEFQRAAVVGEKELGTRELARKWLTVNLSSDIRDGFYKNRQQQLQPLIKQAEGASKTKVQSVMTDRNGSAYFTDLEPGTYLISNIIPTEFGESMETWNCEVTLKPDELGAEKLYVISNRKDKKDKLVKCVSTEKTLPACPAPTK